MIESNSEPAPEIASEITSPAAPKPSGHGAEPRAPNSRRWWRALLAIELLVFLFHLPSFWLPHAEGDEIILIFLAERLRGAPFQYHLQGELNDRAADRFIKDTWAHLYPDRFSSAGDSEGPGPHRSIEALVDPVDGRLLYDPAIYDRPMFFHPPLYPYSLAAFRVALGSAGGPLLSIIFHLTIVLLVALIGAHWGGAALGLLAAGMIAIDPVTWLCTSRLWIDGTLAMMTGASMLALLWALRESRASTFALAGIAFGLACLTKLPATLLVPALGVAVALVPRRPSARSAAAYLVPAGAMIVAWLILTRIFYGAWLAQSGESAWLQERNPFAAMVAARPWHFFLSATLMTAPIYLFSFAGFRRAGSERWTWIAGTWAGSFLLAYFVIGAAGLGFILRYLAPAMPALALLGARGILSFGRTQRFAYGAAIALGAATAASSFICVTDPGLADPIPVALAWCFRLIGLDFTQIFSGMW